MSDLVERLRRARHDPSCPARFPELFNDRTACLCAQQERWDCADRIAHLERVQEAADAMREFLDGMAYNAIVSARRDVVLTAYDAVRGDS